MTKESIRRIRGIRAPSSEMPDVRLVELRANASYILATQVSGNANATNVPPDGAPFFPPPHAMTMYCLPFTT